MSQKRRTIADEPFLVIRTSMADQPAGSTVGQHTHDWHQLIYVRTGLIAVTTAGGSWLGPPSWAVWVPARTPHSIRFVGPGTLRTAYLRPNWRPDLPAGCTALSVSPLLRELIMRATAIGMLDQRVPTEAAVADLIVGELGDVGPAPFALPEPTSPAMIEATRLISDDAPQGASTATIARAIGIATRTLERRFQAETGMTLGRWRQQRMLLNGMERVAAGGSVKDASQLAGYGSASAFIAAFRKTFDATPATYF
jgi:AraC-like DNA-binding protein